MLLVCFRLLFVLLRYPYSYLDKAGFLMNLSPQGRHAWTLMSIYVYTDFQNGISQFLACGEEYRRAPRLTLRTCAGIRLNVCGWFFVDQPARKTRRTHTFMTSATFLHSQTTEGLLALLPFHVPRNDSVFVLGRVRLFRVWERSVERTSVQSSYFHDL